MPVTTPSNSPSTGRIPAILIDRRHEVHLGRARVREEHLDATRDERAQEALGPVHLT
jgi:hypothetical protein